MADSISQADLSTLRTSASGQMTPATATAFGLVAVALWSMLAAITTSLSAIPPFQLVAMSFALASLAGFAWAAVTGESLSALARVPWGYWLLGLYGLFGYHAAYFFALQNAPPIEANLINYFWPLLIVLLSAFLPLRHGGHPLRRWHVAGALLGFAGVVVIIAGGAAGSLGSGQIKGYAAAAAAALIWSSYSVASRFFANVPTLAVMGTSAATAIIAAVVSSKFETAVWPAAPLQWLALLLQGLGPVGLAFYFWDGAMKHGHLRFVGVVSYATPLLSTLVLVATGLAEASPRLWLAAVLVTAGAALGGRELWSKRFAP
jgi:drug/metabolite transporter (DMT)-like permease